MSLLMDLGALQHPSLGLQPLNSALKFWKMYLFKAQIKALILSLPSVILKGSRQLSNGLLRIVVHLLMPFLPERFSFGVVLVSKAAQHRQCVSAVSARELCASRLTLHRGTR